MSNEPWQPLLWLAGAILGYALFMRHHPLRVPFGRGFHYARNNLTIGGGLALLLVAAVAWRFWQETGLGSDGTLALPLNSWEDLLGWIPYANADLRSIVWYCVPIDIAFPLGAPLAFLTSWYWMPRLWAACPKGQRWPAVLIFGIYALALWWWSHRLGEVLRLDLKLVPELTVLHLLLRGTGELVFAVILLCFFQSVLMSGAYRSHHSQSGRCRLVEALDWALMNLPRMIPIPLVVLGAMGISWFAENHLDLKAASVWEAIKLVVLVATAAAPICLLLLPHLDPRQSLGASIQFLLGTGWRYLCFLFICLTHFFLFHLVESYLLAFALPHETSLLVWYAAAALVKAALVIWFLNALCLYFCTSATHGKQGEESAKNRENPADLPARRRARKRALSAHDG